MTSFRDMVSFIWSVADLLRGDYRQSEYGKVILPLTVLRRLDCVLEPTKADVLATYAKHEGKIGNLEPLLTRAARQRFYNTSPLTFAGLLADPENIAANLRTYIAAFSPGAADVLEKYGFDAQITRLDDAELLYQVVGKFADLDLHPDAVSQMDMGLVFEELIRRFSEASNETAGEHFTPREVIRLMVNLLLADDHDTLTTPGIVKTLYDCAAGTGGMLSVAEEWVRELNPAARLEVFGQELNGESYAICRSDLMLKGQDPSHIAFGNSISQDGHAGKTFDYMLANPPFGVEWKKIKTQVDDEAKRGHAGRFGAGLPRVNDGSLLFLQHLVSKMKPASEGGSRIAIVFNGSPLFSGGAGSGESEIRRWIIENDWLEGIVALPDQIFYNTGISTYVWVLSNRKPARMQGRVALLDARSAFSKMRKNLGQKRKQIAASQIDTVTTAYADLTAGASADLPGSLFANDDFGYRRVVVERQLRLSFQATSTGLDKLRASKAFKSLAMPAGNGEAAVRALQAGEQLQADLLEVLSGLTNVAEEGRAGFEKRLKDSLAGLPLPRSAPLMKAIWEACSVPDPQGEPQVDRKALPVADPAARNYENVPLNETVASFIAREVRPYADDAWVDETKTKLGYEIPFTKHFYDFRPPRPLSDIDADIQRLEARIQELLAEVTV